MKECSFSPIAVQKQLMKDKERRKKSIEDEFLAVKQASQIKYNLKTGMVVPKSIESKYERSTEDEFDLNPQPVPETNISNENNSDYEGDQRNIDLKIDIKG